jgi:hypothetical protein
MWRLCVPAGDEQEPRPRVLLLDGCECDAEPLAAPADASVSSIPVV